MTDRFPFSRLESGVDWITWVEPDSKRRGVAEVIGREMIEEERALGSKLKPFAMKGYTGEQCARVAIGSRPDSDLLRISGSLANIKWSRLRSSLGHPTRLDVQTSVWLTESRRGFGRLTTSVAKSRTRSRNGRPPKRTIWQDSKGSWCGMVGTRTSRRFIRCYDKGVEQKALGAGLWWRIELEAKRDLARDLWDEMQEAKDHTLWSYACCERALKSAGSSWLLPKSGETTPLPAQHHTDPPDVARLRKWLATTVQPTVLRLLPALGTEELLKLLGLDPYAIALTDNRSRDL